MSSGGGGGGGGKGGGGGGGGGMGWISNVLGGIGAGAAVRGSNQEARKSNAFYHNLYSPGSINKWAEQLNPYIWAAINGQQGGTGFSKDLYNVAQGKDISPYLLNQPMNEINRGGNENMMKMQAMMGRSGMQGGLGNAYALANLGGQNNARAGLMQNYGQWREGQRRNDLDWIMNQMTGSQNNAFNLAQAWGNKRIQPASWMTKFSRSLMGAASAGGTPYQSAQESTGGGQGYTPYNMAGNQQYNGGVDPSWAQAPTGGNYGEYQPNNYFPGATYGGGGGGGGIQTANPFAQYQGYSGGGV